MRQNSGPDEAIGRAIRVIRTEQGLSRKELAERSGLSYPYVSEIETGKKSPSSKALRSIADAVGLPPHELLAAAETLALGPRSWTSPSRRSFFHESTEAMPMAEPTDDFHAEKLARFSSVAASMPPPEEQIQPMRLRDEPGSSDVEIKEALHEFKQLQPRDRRLVLELIRRLSRDRSLRR